MAASSHSVKATKRHRRYIDAENCALSTTVNLACDEFFRRRGIVVDFKWLNLAAHKERGTVINYDGDER
jgi:hypothetical protein